MLELLVMATIRWGSVSSSMPSFAGVMVVLMSGWLVVGASLAPLLRNPRRARIINVGLAVSLVAATALAIVR